MTKIALITGASGGLGQAMANKLLKENWQLIVVSRDAEKLKTVYPRNYPIVNDYLKESFELSILQSIGVLPSRISISFVFEKCLHPKNPLSAENGDGCGDINMKCFVVSIKGSFA